MPLKKIITVPDEILRKNSDPIEKVGDNEKKLIKLNITGQRLKKQKKLQDQNMRSLSNMLHRIFNQIKVINTN